MYCRIVSFLTFIGQSNKCCQVLIMYLFFVPKSVDIDLNILLELFENVAHLGSGFFETQPILACAYCRRLVERL